MPVLSVRRHLTGDISLPKGTPLKHRLAWNLLLRKIAMAARDCKQRWNINSGYRSYDEQLALYRQNMNAATGRPKPGRPLTAVPGTSYHEGGKAADVSAPGGEAVGKSARRVAALRRRGLTLPVPGEPWHVERA